MTKRPKGRASRIVAAVVIAIGWLGVLVGFAIREITLWDCQPVARAATGQTEAVLVGGKTCFIAPWVGQARSILLVAGTAVCAAGIIAYQILKLRDDERRVGL